MFKYLSYAVLNFASLYAKRFLSSPKALTVASFFLNFPAAFRPSITNFSASLEDLKRKFPFRL